MGLIVILAFIILIFSVLIRAHILKRQGIKAILFGSMDRKDFLIPPFVLFYFYGIFAFTFGLPMFGNQLWEVTIVSYIGLLLVILAPVLFIWGLISFGVSFRVGVDDQHAGELVTSGAFAISRNPLYVTFFMMLCGVFLVFPAWIFFVYMLAGFWLIDRQVCREENVLRELFGEEYDTYCVRVRRYL